MVAFSQVMIHGSGAKLSTEEKHAKLRGFYKSVYKKDYTGPCVACEMRVEGHDDWCTAPKANNLGFTEAKKDPITSKSEIDDMIESNGEQQARDAETDAKIDKMNADRKKPKKPSGKEEVNDITPF